MAPDAPPPTPDDASRIQNIHKTPTQLPTYNNASRTRRTHRIKTEARRRGRKIWEAIFKGFCVFGEDVAPPAGCARR